MAMWIWSAASCVLPPAARSQSPPQPAPHTHTHTHPHDTHGACGACCCDNVWLSAHTRSDFADDKPPDGRSGRALYSATPHESTPNEPYLSTMMLMSAWLSSGNGNDRRNWASWDSNGTHSGIRTHGPPGRFSSTAPWCEYSECRTVPWTAYAHTGDRLWRGCAARSLCRCGRTVT